MTEPVKYAPLYGEPSDTEETHNPEFLLFKVGEELYATKVAFVHEIRRWEGATRLPNAPKDVTGVLQMRGQVIPVVDARSRLGLPSMEYTRENVIICMTGKTESGFRNVALLVETVLRNVALPEIRLAPQWDGQSEGERYVIGLSEYQERQVVILDTDRMLSDALSLADDLLSNGESGSANPEAA